MFVTTQPGRIVLAENITLDAGKDEIVGKDGLFSKIKAKTEGVIISFAENPDGSVGYEMNEGETLEFSGLAKIRGKAAISADILVFDTI